MCNFLSGIILRNEVVLAPLYNQSHSALLRKINIKDNNLFRSDFVKVELLPDNGDPLSDSNRWKYIVDQDNTPGWYGDNKEKYEELFRDKAQRWISKNIFDICGKPCTKIKEENGLTYFHLCKSLFDSSFGENNNYKESDIRKKVAESDYAAKLKATYGDHLVPVSVDLTSLDGLKDYGKLNEDVLSLMDIDLYRQCRANIFQDTSWWWLATPDSTDSGWGSSGVRYVNDVGYVNVGDCRDGDGGVRPFFILKSQIFES